MKRIAALLLPIATLLATPAVAQEGWPNRTITFVVPYAPGGYTDIVGRLTARYVEKALGKTVIIDNKAGAGGIVGTAFVAKAPADGYTFCVCSVGAVSVAPVAQQVQYDPVKDFSPISLVSTIPQTVIVKKSLPIQSMKDLVDYAKANPDKLNYGSSGAGGLMHFAVELFAVRTGAKMTHIPFRGGAPATAAVVAGEVDLSFTNMTDALPQIEAGTVRGLAVTSEKRSPFAPDLPTIAESVLPNFEAESWNGIMAPPGTPEPIVRRMAEILRQMAEDPEVKSAMAKAGATTVSTTPDEYRRKIAQEVEQWSTLVKEIGKGKN